MANFGFSTSPTPAHIFKVMGTNADWTNEQRLDCYIAAAAGVLPDNVANARFMATLNTLGIKQTQSVQVLNKKVQVDIFSANGTKIVKMSDTDKRKAIAAILWKDMDVEVSHKMLSGVTGDALDQMYNKECKAKGDDAPFTMYRLRIGSNVIYRVTNDDVAVESLARQGIKYLVDTKKIPEKDWSTELTS